MQVIAICGPKRVGKDTAASFFTSCNFLHVKISQPLKDVCGSLFGWSPQQMEEDIKDDIDPAWGISPRDALKFFGTEMMQYKIQELLPNVGRKFWIDSLIKRLYKTNQNVVISDMRFMHEYEALKSAFPNCLTTIKITRQTSTTTTADAHSSETEWMQIPEDVLITNDGTIQEMHDQLAKKIN